MKLKVTFREYCLPEKDDTTGEMYRGDYLGSFNEEIEGENVLEITSIASERAEEYSKKDNVDCRVWEIPINVTPRGISSL